MITATSFLFAQNEYWVDVPDGLIAPTGRRAQALAHDSIRGVTVLFGGHLHSRTLGDTWEWDGNTWIQRCISCTAPSPRAFFDMTFDSNRGVCVLYGGSMKTPTSNGGLPLADTWEWNGVNWIMACSSCPPGPRHHYAMTYDSTRARTIMFGGCPGPANVQGNCAPNQLLGDTWEWDGQTWAVRTTATSPPARVQHAMAYDSARQRTVLFGGFNWGAQHLSDTWEYDGSTWVPRAPNRTPGPHLTHKMAFHGPSGRVVTHAGSIGGGNSVGDTWEWDGTDWTRINAGCTPPAREFVSLASDVARGRLVAFGGGGPTGFPQVWEYGSFPGSFRALGQGCTGTGGTPTIAPPPSSPRIGSSYTIGITGLPPSGTVLRIAGLSDAVWQGMQLPYPLASQGAPGCQLFVSPDAVAVLPSRVSWTLTLPNNPCFLGIAIFQQVAVADPPANALGFVLSNYGEAIVGG